MAVFVNSLCLLHTHADTTFLNGESYVSYWQFDLDKSQDDPLKYGLSDSKIRVGGLSDLSIYIRKLDSEAERDEMYETLNRKIRQGKNKRLDFSDYRNFSQVSQIHEDYVMFGTGSISDESNFFALSPSEQAEQEIKTYDPIPLMIESLGDLLENRIRDVNDLKKAFENLEAV